MSSIRPAMAFLRPLPLPQPATVQYFVRRISNKASPAKVLQDRNLVASRTAPRSYPPPKYTSQPRPKESRSSHRTSQPTRTRNYPDKNPAPLRFAADTPLSAEQQSPNLPYYVTRTPSNELPVYHLAKGGGNKTLTRIKRVDGDVEALRQALQSHLQLRQGDCTVNQLNRHVVVKGHVKQEVEAFLKSRKF